MKIVQVGEYSGDLIATTLENRGITDIESYYNPRNDCRSAPSMLRNVREGVERLLKHVKNNSTIGLVVDADMDGYTSASLMYQYIKFLAPDIEIILFFHKGKAHGLTENIMTQIYEVDCKLIIIPDAGSNDVAQIEALEDVGMEVLVIDHHEVDDFTDSGVIVNNQLCEHTNKNLVGVGVVYKFLEYIDEINDTDKVNDYLDLVAAGQIGDSSDISDSEIRYLVTSGLDNISNKFFKTVIGETELGRSISPKDLSFGVIPLINAVVRVGEEDEVKLIFEAMNNIGFERVFPVTKRRKNRETGKFEQVEFNYNLYEQAADVANKCRNRQNALVKKLVTSLESTVDNSFGVAIGLVPPEIDPKGVIGLVANKLVNKFDKPCLLLNQKEPGIWTGSGRGHEKTMPDFRSWCEDTEVVEFAQGHANAFGIGITDENLNKLYKASSEVDKLEAVYEVDLLTNKLDPDLAFVVDNNLRLFGGAVKEPFVGVKELSVPKRFISMRGSMLNIWSWGVSIVQFGANPNFFAEIMEYPEEEVPLNIVGFYGINNWSGKKKPQFIIKDIDIARNNEEVTAENIIF